MTNEEIKQAAEEYVSNLILSEQEEENYKLTFIYGAYSRDEEIEKLRNPWISVEDRLPEEYERVLVKTGRGHFYLAEKDDVAQPRDVFAVPQSCYYVDGVTHWMPIPELKKGE